jgi:hypothetical protein
MFFVLFTIWQLIFNKQVRWVDNIGMTLFFFLFDLFFHWSEIPYKWKRKSGE